MFSKKNVFTPSLQVGIMINAVVTLTHYDLTKLFDLFNLLVQLLAKMIEKLWNYE